MNEQTQKKYLNILVIKLARQQFPLPKAQIIGNSMLVDTLQISYSYIFWID